MNFSSSARVLRLELFLNSVREIREDECDGIVLASCILTMLLGTLAHVLFPADAGNSSNSDSRLLASWTIFRVMLHSSVDSTVQLNYIRSEST